MGGAGFRTHLKWSAVRGARGDVKYVVCNADESEPGTFKDRELMRAHAAPRPRRDDPGRADYRAPRRGTLYIRHEYEEEIDAVREAIAAAEAQGVCGPNVLGSGLAFPLDVFVSPGGYIQGEESALLEAMEDRRGEPRNKPPFPTTNGLFNKPTVINNVETLAWVPAIVMRGGEWYRDQGINGGTGLRFVSISGDVNGPGRVRGPLRPDRARPRLRHGRRHARRAEAQGDRPLGSVGRLPPGPRSSANCCRRSSPRSAWRPAPRITTFSTCRWT